MIYPKTIQSAATINGIGIHSGKAVSMTIRPAPVNTGIVFIRTDLNQSIPVNPLTITPNARATILSSQNAKILTPEHLLATCFALGVFNLRIEIDQEEVPIMDGSAWDFMQLFETAGMIEQNIPIQPLIIQKPILLKESDMMILVLPSPHFHITFAIEYSHAFIGKQVLSLPITHQTFQSDIAKARTYGFYNEIKPLIEQGLAKGGSFDNAVIIDETHYMSELRYPDELVRHKILDLVGDLAVVGRPIHGHFIGVKSGHAMNAQLVKTLALEAQTDAVSLDFGDTAH